MKKIVSIIFVLILGINSISLTSFATEPKTAPTANATPYTQEEINEMACKIWPECADKLMYSTSEKVQLARANDEFEIVHSDSYKISDNETLLYYEYASGYALAAVAEWDTSVYATGSGYTEYLANLSVANGISSSILYGFQYRFNTYLYDKIVFKGLLYNNYATVGGERLVPDQTSSTPASYSYVIVFNTTAGDPYGIANVSIQVGNNDVIVNAG